MNYPLNAFIHFVGIVTSRSSLNHFLFCDFLALPDQGEILRELFVSTNGPGWTRKSHWGSFSPIRDWEGIISNDFNIVSQIVLVGNNLSGEKMRATL